MGKQRRKDIEQQKAREARKSEKGKKKAKLLQEPNLERKLGTDQYKKTILIVSEGKNTEPSYFKQFRNPNVNIHPVGIGKSTVKLVSEVESILNARFKNKKIDEIWVAFDKDNNEDFEDAIKLAASKGYKVAFSNQAIEYWFILHFNDHQGGPMERSQYADIINAAIKHHATYDEVSKIVSREFFQFMQSINPATNRKYIQDAFDRAYRIYYNKEDKLSESITSVFLLVQSITGMETTKSLRQKTKRR